MSSNNITVVGNATRDFELRYTTSGTAVGTVGLAVNRRYQKNGEWQEQTSFFSVTCWGELGENCAASLRKGARVIVTGRLEQRSWETNEGEKRSVVEIVADEVGPSLRWAQAQIERTEREKPTNENRQASSGGGSGGGGTSGHGYDYSEEEPFVRPAQIGDL